MRQFVLGETIAGKYRLNRLLAKGGMGAVWSAWNAQLEVPVAIKFMTADPSSSTELVARFEREAKSAAQLRSPQVVQIYEHGVYDGIPFMVMELLEGEDLGARLRARGRLSLPDTARIVGEVCKALRRAHELGIIHRDLKPGNVFLSQNHDEEVVKVLDFGIAKLLAPTSAGEATRTDALIGTPHYMSPEQARRTNHEVDHRSDLWSLGVIAFRALAGKLPFAGDDSIDVLIRICTQAPPTPSSIAPDLGPVVDQFFQRALAFEPGSRFQSAREFADALNALAGRGSGHELPSMAPSSPAVPSNQHGSELLPTMAHSPPQREREMPDSLDGAQTLPIHRSPAGQAVLHAVAGVAPGFQKTTVPLVMVPPAPQYPPSQSRPSQPDGPEAWPAPQQPQRAPIASAPSMPMPTFAPANESPATITGATGELPAATARRTSVVVWAVAAATVLVLALVGGVVATSMTSPSDATADPAASLSLPAASPPALLPASAATNDVPPATTASAIASAAPSVTASAIASAAPSATTSSSAAPKKYQSPSAIFAPPVFK